MNLRRLFVLTSVLAALVVVAPGAAVAKKGGTDRPVKGKTSGTTTLDIGTGVGVGASEGTGNISHLGKVTYSLNFTLVPSGPTTVAATGTGTVVAANGDRVFSTFTGTGTVPSLVPTVGDVAEFTLVFTLTGGTGRFSDASGTVTATVRQEVVSAVGTTFGALDTGTLTGRISY